MKMMNTTIYSLDTLKSTILTENPILFTGSRTSTVIPFESFELDAFKEKGLDMLFCDLSQLEGDIFLEDNELVVRGAYSWKEAKALCSHKGFSILTSPTEELANILAGIATSATGERSFGHGTLREQVRSLKFMNDKGEIEELSYERPLKDHKLFKNNLDLLEDYQREYSRYSTFKNAPFPRLLRETDLMIGLEGQLGAIVEARLKLKKKEDVIYLFFSLPKWEVDYSPHLELFFKVQNYRGDILSCELIDENSLSYLPKNERIREGRDFIFLEVKVSSFEKVYEELIKDIKNVNEEDIFEVPAQKCHDLRMRIPRAIFEMNTKMGVKKKGTDVQVTPEHFKNLLDYYRSWAKESKVSYNLFGHFGDAHLHFNFMPLPEEVGPCDILLEELYLFVKKIKGSPFAEHGVGLMKKPFIYHFYSQVQKDMFSFLKRELDPKNIFFPNGFMKDSL